MQKVDHPELGTVELLRMPARMSKSDVPMVAAPLLGEHTNEVLIDDLNCSEAEIAELREAGIVD